MSLLILTTKISTPPVFGSVIIRERLLHRLDLGLRQKLTLISAPAGSGKTTLVSSWIRRRFPDTASVAWLSLGKDDNDPTQFFYYFIAALERIRPGIEQILQPILNTFRITDFKKLIVLTINHLAREQSPTVLVLDDYHLILNAELHEALSFFIDHLPSNFKLVIVTREQAPLPLHKLRASGELSEISYDELRFSESEISAFLSETMGLNLSEQTRRELEARTEGWIAGLQMIALTFRGEMQAGEDLRKIVHETDCLGCGNRYILDYFAAEVLHQLPTKIRSFLVCSSILDRFNASLCDALLECNDSQSILPQLEKANMFLVPLDAERNWFRYHHLFADLLRSELITEERARLHLRASQWFARQGMTPEAIQHAIAAKDFETAVVLIRSRYNELLSKGDYATLLEWVSLLPERVVLEHLDMTVAKGWILLLKGELGPAQNYVARVMEDIPQTTPREQRGIVQCFRTFLFLNSGRMKEALASSQTAMDLQEDSDSFFYATAKGHLGIVQGLAGDQVAATRFLREAFERSSLTGNHMASLEILAVLIALLNRQGELAEARLLVQQVLPRYLDHTGAPQPILFSVLVSMGELYYEFNDLEKAESCLATGIALSEVIGVARPIILGHLTSANLNFALGRTDEMEQSLAAALKTATASAPPVYSRMVEVQRAQLYIRADRLEEASRILNAQPLGQKERPQNEILVLTSLMLAEGRAQEASDLLAIIKSKADKRGRRRKQILVLLRQAQAYHLLDQPAESARCLEEAIQLSAVSGYQRLILDEGPVLRFMLRDHVSAFPDYVAGLQEAFLQSPPSIAAGPAIASNEGLSPAQIRILRLVAQGLSNKEIADRLEISEGTAKWHLNQVYAKLNVKRRTQAIAEARQQGLL